MDYIYLESLIRKNLDSMRRKKKLKIKKSEAYQLLMRSLKTTSKSYIVKCVYKKMPECSVNKHKALYSIVSRKKYNNTH